MKTMWNRSIRAGLIVGALGVGFMAGCETAPETAEGKQELRRTSADAIRKAQANDPGLENVLKNAPGYAVFPSIGKGAVGVGGAYGKGDLYEHGRIVGYCDLTQATIGAQLGGQAYTEIIVFQTQDAVDSFKQGHLQFDAQASAVALKSGASANAKYANGVAVFTSDPSGLMGEASIGGQKFSYQPRDMNGPHDNDMRRDNDAPHDKSAPQY